MLWPEVPALSYWSKSLKSPRDQGFGHVALVLSYFRNIYLMNCPLSLWCSLLLARRRFQIISRFSTGTWYTLFCMGTGSCKLWYLHETHELHQMCIPQGSAVFSRCWCCSKGRKMGRSLLPASFGREVYSPRALSLVALSSQSPLSLCLSPSTNRNLHPVSCQ